MEDKYIEKLQEIDDRSRSNVKRLDNQEKKIDELEKTYAIMEKMNYRMGKVENAVERIDNKIQNNDKNKGMKWDKLVDYLFYALLAYALFKLGLK